MPKRSLANQPKRAPSEARPAPSKNPFARNTSFNQQTRKVLAKHYRAKLGVK